MSSFESRAASVILVLDDVDEIEASPPLSYFKDISKIRFRLILLLKSQSKIKSN